MTSTLDPIDLLRRSELFREWGPNTQTRKSLDLKTHQMAVKHYTPEELAELWGVSTETIRSIFRGEPGVLKIGKTGSKYKRGYVTLRIPHDIAERVHTRLSA